MQNTTNDYESLTYKLRLKRALKNALIVLLICIVVIAPALWFWDQSVQKRQILREAKNVVMNVELLGVEYYGIDSPIIDKGRPSGMSKQAEEEVRGHAGVDGEIYLVSWNAKKNCVTTMNYQKGRFLVEYQYDEAKDYSTWNIYWNVQQYDN